MGIKKQVIWWVIQARKTSCTGTCVSLNNAMLKEKPSPCEGELYESRFQLSPCFTVLQSVNGCSGNDIYTLFSINYRHSLMHVDSRHVFYSRNSFNNARCLISTGTLPLRSAIFTSTIQSPLAT